MSTYIGFIKVNKNERYRGVIAVLHDVGEGDGDRVVQSVADSPDLHDNLDDAIKDLKEQCKDNNIKMYFEPIRLGQILWESSLR